METVDVDDRKLEEVTIELNTDKLGIIKTIFDSGASISCIAATYARTHYSKYIKNEKPFKVRTANGCIILKHYIHLKITEDKKQFLTRWYLLPNSPFKFILSRKLFFKLGYRISKPGEFNNEATQEELSEDLYCNITKHLEINTPKKNSKRPVEIVNLIKEYDSKQPLDTREIFQNKPHIPHVAVIENEVNKEVLEQISGQIKDKTTRKDFEDIIRRNEQNYAADAADIGTIPGVEFEIKLMEGATPVNSKPYPLPYQHADEVKKQMQQLIKAGIIRKSKSSWASPTIVVPKPDRNGKKEWRVCIDYRELNRRTIKDKYTIPSMRDLYRKLRGNKIFSNIDLRSGYYHIPIKQEDQHKTAFITDDGLYEWKRMTFGFCNAPATFQRAMDKIFDGLEFVVIYLDDVIICSKTEGEHITHLRLIFERIRTFNLKLRLIKCKFFQTEIKYLGLIVNKHGIKCDQEYAHRLLNLKIPTGHKEL